MGVAGGRLFGFIQPDPQQPFGEVQSAVSSWIAKATIKNTILFASVLQDKVTVDAARQVSAAMAEEACARRSVGSMTLVTCEVERAEPRMVAGMTLSALVVCVDEASAQL